MPSYTTGRLASFVLPSNSFCALQKTLRLGSDGPDAGIFQITSRVWRRRYTHRAIPRPTSKPCRNSCSLCLACKRRTKC
jgi:hypothetical protein